MVSGIQLAGKDPALRNGKLCVLPAVSAGAERGDLHAHFEQGAEQQGRRAQYGIYRRNAPEGIREQEEVPEGAGGEDGEGVRPAAAGGSERGAGKAGEAAYRRSG